MSKLIQLDVHGSISNFIECNFKNFDIPLGILLILSIPKILIQTHPLFFVRTKQFTKNRVVSLFVSGINLNFTT